MLDSDSAKYYVRTQFGDDESILDQMTANLQNPSFVSEQWAIFRNRLLSVGSLLKSHDEASKQLLIHGASATHADSTLFGWYAISRVNEGWREGWEHEELPYVKRWTENMVKIVGESELI